MNIIPMENINKMKRSQILNIFNKNLLQNKNNLKSIDKNKNKNLKMTKFLLIPACEKILSTTQPFKGSNKSIKLL